MNDWISIKDRLPEFDQTIISTDGDYIAITTFTKGHGEFNFWQLLSSGCGCCDTDMGNVTHWMPLPKPPKE